MTDLDASSLLDDLTRAGQPAPPPRWTPGVTFSGRMPDEIVTPPLPAMESQSEFEAEIRRLGYPLPEGYTLMLVEMVAAKHENFWTREGPNQDALTKPSTSWRYRFKVVPKDPRADEDLDILMKRAEAAADGNLSARRRIGAPLLTTTKVVNLADGQFGKVDTFGDSEDTLARFEAALAEVVAMVMRDQPAELILSDVGDSTEGFESAPNAAQMNDLSLTRQVRIWRRVLWRWIEELSPLVPSLKVVGVPSNHCRVRKGKAALADALDDWGIEVISQVQDLARAAGLDNTTFIIPDETREHVLIEAAGGLLLGFIHGHQAGRPEALPDIIKRNARSGIGQADIVVAGHFHHLVCRDFGDGQTLFICPAMDNGSSWFQYSGEQSRPGLLTFDVDEAGWYNLDVIRFAISE